jgi:hypothetical protein
MDSVTNLRASLNELSDKDLALLVIAAATALGDLDRQTEIAQVCSLSTDAVHTWTERVLYADAPLPEGEGDLTDDDNLYVAARMAWLRGAA